jgi:hypothetical protein
VITVLVPGNGNERPEEGHFPFRNEAPGPIASMTGEQAALYHEMMHAVESVNTFERDMH